MPVRCTPAVVLLVVVFVVTLAPVAGAEPTPEDLRKAQARLSAAENDFNLAVDRYEEARAELASLQQDTAQAERRVALLQAQVVEGRKSVARVAGQMYRHAGQDDFTMLLSATGIADAGRRIGYLNAIQQAHTRMVERATADERALEASLAQLREASSAAKATAVELGRMRNELESVVGRQRGEVGGIQDAIARAERAFRDRAPLRGLLPPRLVGPDLPPPLPGLIPGPQSGAQAAVRAALAQLGKPYRWGAAGPATFDCSGLTLWAWARAGVLLPHSASAQYAMTRHVAPSQWQPGDLLFFGRPIHHVGMYIGGGKMVAAPHSGAVVRISLVSNRGDYVGAGRP
jgi:peptidoglycan DL-endopeptidase CwlO